MAYEKLSGTLNNYRKRREHALFFFTEDDDNALGIIAVAAAAAGLGGAAMGTAMSAPDMEEAAHRVEFDINGQPASGWLWHSGRVPKTATGL
jgi:hypothetical protein